MKKAEWASTMAGINKTLDEHCPKCGGTRRVVDPKTEKDPDVAAEAKVITEAMSGARALYCGGCETMSGTV